MKNRFLHILIIGFLFFNSVLQIAFAQQKQNKETNGSYEGIPSVADDLLYHRDEFSVSTMFPNPFSLSENSYVELNYAIPFSIATAKITLTNILGTTVGEYFLMYSQKTIRIYTSHFSPGIYFYTLSIDGKNISTKKIVVKS